MEARLAVASLRGSQVVVEHAFSMPLREAGSGGNRAGPEVGAQIAAALASRGIGKGDTLVAVGRGNIELRQFSVPPAPDDELPELVRFQALREFTGLQEAWALDFVPIDDSPEQARRVLAAAVGPELVEEIQQTCKAAGLRLRRLLLRPFAAASLLQRRSDPRLAQARLLIDLLADEADLTVLIDQKVVFLRTTRLPGDPLAEAEAAQALVGEIRRTVVAAQNQLGSQRVETVVLCGTGAQQASLAEAISQQVAAPVELFDPFAGLQLEGDLRQALPERPGRFAPLLGVLVDELSGSRHAMDFLHPRRRPEPLGRRRTYVVAGLAAAAAALLVVFLGWFHLSALDDQAQDLQEQLERWDRQVTQAAKFEQAAGEVQKWIASEVVWLDELRRLAEKLPPPAEAMLTQLTAVSGETSGPAGASKSGRSLSLGEIMLEGLARSVDAAGAMEQALLDKTHQVETKHNSEDTAQKPYSWRFKSSVHLRPEPR